MNRNDVIGGRGENIASIRLSKPCRPGGMPYFWPRPLGEKCETFDMLVELVDAGEMKPFFFVQVKTTQKALTTTQTPPRLRVEVAESDVLRMAAFPAPTYVIGVHEPDERAFVVAVIAGMGDAIPSITTGHELTKPTLELLWHEVLDYWRTRHTPKSTSRFVNLAERPT